MVNLKNPLSALTATDAPLSDQDDSLTFRSPNSKLILPIPNFSQLRSGALAAWVRLDTKPAPNPSVPDRTLFGFSSPLHRATLLVAGGDQLTLDPAGSKGYTLQWEADEWHHVKLVWEHSADAPTRAFVFVDGTLVKEAVWPTEDLVDTLWVGNGVCGAEGLSCPLLGQMRDVRVWRQPVYDNVVSMAPYASICTSERVFSAVFVLFVCFKVFFSLA